MTTSRTTLKILLGMFYLALVGVSALLVAAYYADSPTTYRVSTPLSKSTQTAVTQQQATATAQQAVPGSVSEVSLQNVNGVQTYVVEIEDANAEYEVLVNAQSGSIDKIIRENDVGAQELDLVSPVITQEDAAAIALQVVQGQVTDIEAEKIDDTYVWEVEVSSGSQETDVLIDMMSGLIVAIETEDEEEELEEISNTQSTVNRLISRAEAEQIARNEIGGTVTDFEKEGSNYEVEIKKGGDEYDVLIDSRTGEIIEIDKD